MIEWRYLSRIEVKIIYLDKVMAAYNNLKTKGYIEFIPTGIFSGYVDVVYDNYLLRRELIDKDVPFRRKKAVESFCVSANNVEFKPKEDRLNEIAMNIEKLAERLTIVEKNMNKEVNIDEIKKKIFEEMVSVVDSSTLEYPENKK